MNDNQRVSFICYVTNNPKAEALSHHLNSLIFPPGYTIDKVFLEGEYCKSQAYNIAMGQSVAKYKIYLHQNTKIENPFLLNGMLSLFQDHPELGMLGVIGAKRLPRNGNWREASERFGKVSYSGKLVQYQEIAHDYEPVQVVDGLIIATQYDLHWREDLFLGEFFYDSAQCLEFIRAGYQVGVVKQRDPWCSYDHTNDSLVHYYHERDVFIGAYAKFLNLPLPG